MKMNLGQVWGQALGARSAGPAGSDILIIMGSPLGLPAEECLGPGKNIY